MKYKNVSDVMSLIAEMKSNDELILADLEQSEPCGAVVVFKARVGALGDLYTLLMEDSEVA